MNEVGEAQDLDTCDGKFTSRSCEVGEETRELVDDVLCVQPDNRAPAEAAAQDVVELLDNESLRRALQVIKLP